VRPRVVSRTPLLYRDGADPKLDRPGHVRAGSALVVWGEHLAVIQDDASFLALIHRATGQVHDVPFPGSNVRQFDDSRGNKKSKLDLEAVFLFQDWLVAMGSGSSPLRERFVIVEGTQVRVREMHAFYTQLRNAFEGELNIEGAIVDGDDLLLFQRGNGVDAKNQTARANLTKVFAGEAPEVRDVQTWTLPDALTFTDATRRGDEIWFLACAEDSPDATRDGPVSAVALGRMRDRVETWPILDEHGAPLLEKTEGLAFDPDDPTRLYVVTDRDDATLPSDLLVVSLDA
jgi:hypothetical protein